MDEAETRSWLEVHHSLTFTRLSSLDQRQQETQTSSHDCHSFVAPDEKIRRHPCTRLQSRHPAPTSQSRFSSTKAEIRKVVDLDGSFHTHRHDAITGAKKKKKVRLERFLHHQETNHCLLWPSRARRHRTHRQLKSSSRCTAIPAHDRRRRRKAKTTRGRTWLTTNRQVFYGSGAASQCAFDMTRSNRSKGRTTRPTAARINRHFLTQTSFCRRNDLCPHSVEVSFSVSVFQHSDSVWLRVPRPWPGMPRSASLASVTNCCWIHPTFFYLKWRPSREWWDTSQIHGLFRPQKLVEASSNSTTINLLKLPKMWRLLIRVEKRLMVLSFVPEPTRRNIPHLKDYPVFKVFFFDFRTLAVSWSTRYASAQRAAHCDSRTTCAIETSKARVPRYEPQKARVPWYQRTSTRRNKYAVSLKSKTEKWTTTRAYEFVRELLRGWN